MAESGRRPSILNDPIKPKIEKWRTTLRQSYNIDEELEGDAPLTVDLGDAAINDKVLRTEYQPILGEVKCVLVDLDGTLFNIRHADTAPTTSAVEAYQKLKDAGLKVILLVNTWLQPKAAIHQLIETTGFTNVAEEDIFTSTDCCKTFMHKNCCQRPFLLVADDILTDFEEFKMDGFSGLVDYDCVIVGLPSTMIDYRLLTKAISLLDKGKPMLVLNPSRMQKVVGSTSVLGPGVFANTLEFALDAKEFIFGKPTTAFFSEACAYAGFPINQCVMIGDDAYEDIRGAKIANLPAILVKTGKYTKGDECNYCGDFGPDVIADDFATAVKLILCALSKDPILTEAEIATAADNARRKTERDEFAGKLAAYVMEDCGRNNVVCPLKMPSIIW